MIQGHADASHVHLVSLYFWIKRVTKELGECQSDTEPSKDSQVHISDIRGVAAMKYHMWDVGKRCGIISITFHQLFVVLHYVLTCFPGLKQYNLAGFIELRKYPQLKSSTLEMI